jgi:hypothetical protein
LKFSIIDEVSQIRNPKFEIRKKLEKRKLEKTISASTLLLAHHNYFPLAAKNVSLTLQRGL